MKWSIAGLLFFGVVAAVCAAVLVASLRVETRARSSSGEVQFLVAAKDLPRSKILDPDSIVEKSVPVRDAPEGHIANAVGVIGKVLALPMVEGQPFTKSCFASEGTGYRVASVLPEGMRAVTISLYDYAGLSGLLYPGCSVDVLTSFRMTGNQAQGGEAMSTTLLQGIQVLAAEGETLVSATGQNPEGRKTSEGPAKKLLVTLMVDLEQAAALQLASQYGSITLALRNPMDKAPVKRIPTLLSQLTSGNIRSLAPLGEWLKRFGGAVREILKDHGEMAAALRGASPSPLPEAPPPLAVAEPAKQKGLESGPVVSDKEKENAWKVILIKAGVISTQSFVLPPEDGGRGEVGSRG